MLFILFMISVFLNIAFLIAGATYFVIRAERDGNDPDEGPKTR